MTAIDIDIQEKTYSTSDSARRYTAIRNLKFKLESHEFVCLVGPSGCGKTTLLHLIAGLDSDFQGKIKMMGSQQEPVIGYVFQEPRLLPWRTVKENVLLALQPQQDESQVDPLLKITGLTEFSDVYPNQLSLGMSRRVAIVRAFAVNPDLLLLDEPFVSLDIPTAKKIRALLVGLWQQRPHTILFVTHDIQEAISLADRLIFLSPSPASIIGEFNVAIKRSQRSDKATIGSFLDNILSHHPQIKSLIE